MNDFKELMKILKDSNSLMPKKEFILKPIRWNITIEAKFGYWEEIYEEYFPENTMTLESFEKTKNMLTTLFSDKKAIKNIDITIIYGDTHEDLIGARIIIQTTELMEIVRQLISEFFFTAAFYKEPGFEGFFVNMIYYFLNNKQKE